LTFHCTAAKEPSRLFIADFRESRHKNGTLSIGAIVGDLGYRIIFTTLEGKNGQIDPFLTNNRFFIEGKGFAVAGDEGIGEIGTGFLLGYFLTEDVIRSQDSVGFSFAGDNCAATVGLTATIEPDGETLRFCF
jgi:hypothetical protein